MWVFAILLGIIGLLGLVAPDALRGTLRVFTRNGAVRILGMVLLLVGMQMFIRAPSTSLPLLVKALAVILFVKGGVSLFIPTVNVMFTERAMEQGPLLLRLAGLASLSVGYLFYLATKLPPPPAVVEDVEQVLQGAVSAVAFVNVWIA